MTHALCSKSEIKIIDTQNQPNYDPREPKTILLNMSGVQCVTMSKVAQQNYRQVGYPRKELGKCSLAALTLLS